MQKALAEGQSEKPVDPHGWGMGLCQVEILTLTPTRHNPTRDLRGLVTPVTIPRCDCMSLPLLILPS